MQQRPYVGWALIEEREGQVLGQVQVALRTQRGASWSGSLNTFGMQLNAQASYVLKLPSGERRHIHFHECEGRMWSFSGWDGESFCPDESATF